MSHSLNNRQEISEDYVVDAAALLNTHNELLQQMPAGATHSADECPLCNGSFVGDQASEGGVMSTYTEEQLSTAITDAVAPLQARIRELEASQEQATFEVKVAEATEPLEVRISEMQAQLDASVLEAEAAKNEYTSLVTYLEGVKAQEDEKAVFEVTREQRLAQVRENASFPEAHIEANADRWARMDEELFLASLEDWKLISAKPPKELAGVPTETAMQASSGSDNKPNEGMGLLKETFDMIIRGTDPRRV